MSIRVAALSRRLSREREVISKISALPENERPDVSGHVRTVEDITNKLHALGVRV
jgi:hypothetical protein